MTKKLVDHEKTIYNCHTHLFTLNNIPKNYLPFSLVPNFRQKWFRTTIGFLLKLSIPWSRYDRLNRIAAFLKAACQETQEDNFRELNNSYPKETRFVVLPMDLELMRAGKLKVGIDDQHAELAQLRDKFGSKIIPFAHIDPRHKSALSKLQNLVEEKQFKGVKIYPALGYPPTHPRLINEIYPYMVEKNIPLMAHCSPGIVYNHDLGKKYANNLGHPDNYQPVLDAFPELRICLAHFGGIDEWKNHIQDPAHRKNTWLSKIMKMLENQHKNQLTNLYVDIAYTVFNFKQHVPLLKILLEYDHILPQVLFGSDYYLVYNEKYSEKRLSIDLRATLGEEKFWQIANINPIKYLGITRELK